MGLPQTRCSWPGAIGSGWMGWDCSTADFPIINLIQHVRHADDWSIQSQYLEREGDPPLRQPGGRAGGDRRREPGADDRHPERDGYPGVGRQPRATRPVDLLIAGLKQPVLAGRVAEALSIAWPDDRGADRSSRPASVFRCDAARAGHALSAERRGGILSAGGGGDGAGNARRLPGLCRQPLVLLAGGELRCGRTIGSMLWSRPRGSRSACRKTSGAACSITRGRRRVCIVWRRSGKRLKRCWGI